jgi:hypothetical protein
MLLLPKGAYSSRLLGLTMTTVSGLGASTARSPSTPFEARRKCSRRRRLVRTFTPRLPFERGADRRGVDLRVGPPTAGILTPVLVRDCGDYWQVVLRTDHGDACGAFARAWAQDRYAGLLVSMHGTGISRGRYGIGPRLTLVVIEVRS